MIDKEAKKEFKQEQKAAIKANRKYSKNLTYDKHAPKKVAMPENTCIVAKNLWKIVANKDKRYEIIKGINLHIKFGEFIIIFGESGSGKTSLLSLLSALERPSEGEVHLLNYNTKALKNHELTKLRLKNIGYIFQQYGLLQDISVLENIKIAAPHVKTEDIRQVVRKLDFENIIDNKIINLSGGQQQRISIARAVVKKPKILFADEPTGAVDAQTARQILEMFIKLNQQQKTTIVLVSHNKNLIPLASRIITIVDGQIATDELNPNQLTINDVNLE